MVGLFRYLLSWIKVKFGGECSPSLPAILRIVKEAGGTPEPFSIADKERIFAPARNRTPVVQSVAQCQLSRLQRK
jgi:hypothetical protein